MDSGICAIKPEFVISFEEENSKHCKDLKIDGGIVKDDIDLNEKIEPEAKKPKYDKKSKKRGQNKARPLFKESRDSKLCKSLLNGKNNNDIKCSHPNCVFIHDIEIYLKTKPEDIDGKCYIYATKGFCKYGLTCRFSSCHINDELNNMTSDNYDTNSIPTVSNQISNELQLTLRNKAYNFDKSKNILENIDLKKINAKEIEKLNGFSEDTDIIKERDCEKKKIDFKNKLFLSPLTTVGNLPFRRICKEYGADITCGEMSCSLPILNGQQQEWALIKRHHTEDIFGVQLCSNKLNVLAYSTELLLNEANIDFIDINLGCPIDMIYKSGGGSALLGRHKILELMVRSCSSLLNDKPLTIKTRTGIYSNKNVAHELIPKFEEWGASLVTVHGRSREQRYTKNANWEYVEKCAQQAKNIPIIGNGDILSYDDYNEAKKVAPHASGVMIGRGALIKPWIFKEIKEEKYYDPSSSERFDLIKKYINYGLEHWGSDTKGVENTRRFFLEWQSFLYRYVPHGLLLNPPQKINQRPQYYRGRDDLETLLSSPNCNDWIKISEMLLGPVPDGFVFLPKHKANSY